MEPVLRVARGLDKEGSVAAAKREGLCSVCEKRYGLWKRET